MTFRVGQKVVCVDEPRAHMMAKYPGSNYPRKNGIYTIRQINDWPTGTLLMFHELDNSHFVGKPIDGVSYGIEPGFAARHFRPIVERKTDIGFAHEILRKVSRKDRVSA